MRILYLVLFSSLVVGSSSAQIASSELSSESDIDYFLKQAFFAKTSADRAALNHIGIESKKTEGGHLITAVLEGYPAHAHDIRRGDIIKFVDGSPFHPVESFNFEKDNDGNFLPTKQEHKLVVFRSDVSIELSVTPVYENLFDSYRSATSNSVLEFSAGNKTIGYVRFWALSRSTNDIINYQTMLAELDDTDGIIFDFRNGLGFLDPQHLDLIFPNRSNYFSYSYASGPLMDFSKASPNSAVSPYRKPIAVLINEGTRGGTELFAYQLDKLQRVVSLGEITRGEISNYLFDDSFRKEELRIDGKLFHNNSISPEKIITYPYEDTKRGDPQFDAAINALLGII